MFKPRLALALVGLFTLSACLENDLQRGLVGAAGGAVVAGAVGVDPITGALVGGAAGALCDQVTRACR